jgi:hypothetical protein
MKLSFLAVGKVSIQGSRYGSPEALGPAWAPHAPIVSMPFGQPESAFSGWRPALIDTFKGFILDRRQSLYTRLPARSHYAQPAMADIRGCRRGYDIHYGIEYDGVDIRKLSQGTRGIVLLLLYLALDDGDGRPLIIDQPEENLDSKSVFEELVGLFIEAKSNRQVIMVTHNANLVINTDADRIIIAESGPHPHGALPPITYPVVSRMRRLERPSATYWKAAKEPSRSGRAG